MAVAGTAACDARREGDAPPTTSSALVIETLAAGDAFGVPADLLVRGENLVVVDPMADSAVHVLRLRDGATVRRLGRRGDGPGEFRGIWNASPGGTDPRFRVFDAAHVRVTTVDLDAPRIGPTAAVPGVPLYQLHVVDDTLAFALGFFADGGRFAVLRPDGSGLRTVGGDAPGDTAVPHAVRSHAAQGTLAYAPDPGRVVIAWRHADRLDIFRADGTPVRTIRGPDGFDPVYRVADRGGMPVMDSGDDLRFGYVDAVATDAGIVALYSGRTRAEAPGRASLGASVREFGWDGRLRGEWRLDVPATSLEIAPGGREWLVGVIEPEPGIVRIRRP